MQLLAILRTYQAFLVVCKRYYCGPFANIRHKAACFLKDFNGQVFTYNFSATPRRAKYKTFLEEADQHGLVYDSVALI